MEGQSGSLASSSDKPAVQSSGYGASGIDGQAGRAHVSKPLPEGEMPQMSDGMKKGLKARLSWRDQGPDASPLHEITPLTEHELEKIVGAEGGTSFGTQVSAFSEKSTGWRRDFNDGVALASVASPDDFERQLSGASVCTIVERV